MAIIHAFAKKIEIFSNDGERIAIHTRYFSGRRYVTDSEHMPENHKHVLAFRSYDGKFYRSKARLIGQSTETFVSRLLENADFEEQAYKSCMGVLTFSRNYGNYRVEVEKACEKALRLNSVTYTPLKNILKKWLGISGRTR